MLLGGMDSKYSYLDDVELYAPKLPCHQQKLPKYPLRVVGAVGAFTGRSRKYTDKKIIICGGATRGYTGCRTHGRGQTCSKNVECVKTKGGAEWCFGPKTKDCYTYE